MTVLEVHVRALDLNLEPSNVTMYESESQLASMTLGLVTRNEGLLFVEHCPALQR